MNSICIGNVIVLMLSMLVEIIRMKNCVILIWYKIIFIIMDNKLRNL